MFISAKFSRSVDFAIFPAHLEVFVLNPFRDGIWAHSIPFVQLMFFRWLLIAAMFFRVPALKRT